MDVQADRLDYYSDHYLLLGQGGVTLRLADGTIITGNYFAMDIHANRYLVAGHVRIAPRNGTPLLGAAYSNFLDFQRAYYLPVMNGPDRWTFFDGKFTDPRKGRENPGDAFALADVPTGHPYIEAHKAHIIPRHLLRFDKSMLNTGLVIVPVPNYVLNLSQNSNFAHNSLVGARFDASYPFAGSVDASTSLHFREDQQSGVFAGIEQKIATEKGYLVGSIEPLDKNLKQYNLLGSTEPSPKLQIEGFAQDNSFQRYFEQPLNASVFVNGKLTKALGHSYVQMSVLQFYQSILGAPPASSTCNCYGNNADHVWVPNHPVQLQLNWVGYDEKVNDLPLHYRLRSGFSYAHDVYGIEAPPNTLVDPIASAAQTVGLNPITLTGLGVQTITSRLLGGTLYTNSIHLAHDHHGNYTNLNASFDMQRQSYSLPHHVDSLNTSVSMSKAYGTHNNVSIGYTMSNVRDNYGVQQTLAYAPSLAGSPSFGGYGTTRTYSESYIYTPNPNFNINVSNAHTSDYFGLYGNSVSGELRARLLPHLTIDLSRIYYYGGTVTQRWSPAFGIYIGQ